MGPGDPITNKYHDTRYEWDFSPAPEVFLSNRICIWFKYVFLVAFTLAFNVIWLYPDIILKLSVHLVTRCKQGFIQSWDENISTVYFFLKNERLDVVGRTCTSLLLIKKMGCAEYLATGIIWMKMAELFIPNSDGF